MFFLPMIKTYTVRDPDNPNVLMDIDVKEIGYQDYPMEGSPKDVEDESVTKKIKRDPIITVKDGDKTVTSRSLLLTKYRHVYKFLSIFASMLGVSNMSYIFRDRTRGWEDQQVFRQVDETTASGPSDSAEVLEQCLDGIYYGILESAMTSIMAFQLYKITLKMVVDSIQTETGMTSASIVSNFLKYAVTMHKAGNVAGFSAQPGRVYTRGGNVALNVHAGLEHRNQIRQELNYYQIWFYKVRNANGTLIVNELNTIPGSLGDLARREMAFKDGSSMVVIKPEKLDREYIEF